MIQLGKICFPAEKNKIATDLGYFGHLDLIKQEYLSGKSMSEVAKISGITTATVWKLLKRMDVPRRSRGGYNYKGKKYHER